MIFDSEEQRQQLIQLILQVPVVTDVASAIRDGPIPLDVGTATMLKAINDAEIAEQEEEKTSAP